MKNCTSQVTTGGIMAAGTAAFMHIEGKCHVCDELQQYNCKHRGVGRPQTCGCLLFHRPKTRAPSCCSAPRLSDSGCTPGVSLSTVGYGDITPQTKVIISRAVGWRGLTSVSPPMQMGKAGSIVMALIGLGLFAECLEAIGEVCGAPWDALCSMIAP